MSKKALSPLIASILLIALSITVGALMAAFSHNFTSEAVILGDTYSLESRCSAAKLSISKLNDDYRICHNGTNMVFVVSNDATSDVEGFKFVIFDKNFISYEFEFLELFKAGHYKKINITLNDSLKNISNFEELRLIPYVVNKDKKIVACPEPSANSIKPSIITSFICE